MGIVRFLVLVFFLSVSAHVAEAAERREVLTIESGTRAKPAKIHAELFLPEISAGKKIPAMLIMHGSSAPRDRREGAYAREFLKLGIAAVIIDSFGPRGIKSTVRDQGQVSSTDMYVDAVNTMRAVAERPEIDASRIGMIGFSKGGTVVTKAALQRYKKFVAASKHEFSLLIAMYPWCGDMPLDFTSAGAPLVMMLGEDDTYAGVPACKEFAARLEKQGGKVTVMVLAKAKHGWDTPGPESWSDAQGQNFSQCIYEEVESGTWIERKSGIKVEDKGKRTGKSKDAQQRCGTLGVSGGYSRSAHEESMALIRAAIREKFELR